MALGFKMGASGEKPRTETYNVTENGTFDMGAKNLYRYVNANINTGRPSISYKYSIVAPGSATEEISINLGSDYVPLILDYNQFFNGSMVKIKEISSSSIKYYKNWSGATRQCALAVVGLSNVKNFIYFYEQTIGQSATKRFNFGFSASSTGQVFVNILHSTPSFRVDVYSTYCTITNLTSVGRSNVCVQIFEFE